ncbi:MAG TPA: 50S ribosomal protein L25 [Acidimicrobiales bacterium]|nr:50S ribosomal protein L25 [Acidimicrobiales bacterium]
MAEVALMAQVGRPTGSRATRRLRRDGLIPGVVYGHGTAPVSVAVVGKELRTALSGESGSNTLLSLQAGDQTFLTLAREMQRHPVRGTVTHVDFQIVRRDEVISADVPVALIGEALEVHHGDGLVDQQLFTLPVRARPADIPTVVEVDVSELIIGAAIRVADLRLPEGVVTDLDGEVAIVVGQPPRLEVVEPEPVVEGEEGAAEAEAPEAATADSGPGTDGD